MVFMIQYIVAYYFLFFFFFQAEDGIRDIGVTGVQTCALPICVVGGTLFANTDDSAQAALTNSTAGTVERFDLATGRQETLARGLTMPNGLAILPGGDLVVSRALGSGTGVTRIALGDPARPQFNWSPAEGTNGLAVDPAGRVLYAAVTFQADSPVIAIDIANPAEVRTVARLTGAGPPKGLDDMTVDADGVLYLAANATGEIVRLDPGSGQSCVIATGMRQPSSVKFGCGPGWPSERLYVSSFDGTVREV